MFSNVILKRNNFFVHVLPYRVRNVSNAHLKDLHNNRLQVRPRPMLQEQSQSDMPAEANREAYNYSKCIQKKLSGVDRDCSSVPFSRKGV